MDGANEVEVYAVIGGKFGGFARGHSLRQRADAGGALVGPGGSACKAVVGVEVKMLGVHLKPPRKLHRLPCRIAAAEDAGADRPTGEIRRPRELQRLGVRRPEFGGAAEHALARLAELREALLIHLHRRERLREVAGGHLLDLPRLCVGGACEVVARLLIVGEERVVVERECEIGGLGGEP